MVHVSVGNNLNPIEMFFDLLKKFLPNKIWTNIHFCIHRNGKHGDFETGENRFESQEKVKTIIDNTEIVKV